MLESLNLSNPISLIIALVIVVFLVLEVVNGYKKGFLESSVRLVGFILVIIGSFLLKNPLSVYLYTNFPFFKFSGTFKGLYALNIIAYEIIAFILLFVVLYILFKVICEITKLVDKLLSLIFLIGIPNKILGAILGFVQGIVTLYFVIAVFKIGTNLFGYEMKPSLADYIVEVPILKQTFGSTLDSLDEITNLAKNYEFTKDKDEANEEVLDILLEYDIISKENLDKLIDSGKISVNDSEEETND